MHRSEIRFKNYKHTKVDREDAIGYRKRISGENDGGNIETILS